MSLISYFARNQLVLLTIAPVFLAMLSFFTFPLKSLFFLLSLDLLLYYPRYLDPYLFFNPGDVSETEKY